MHQRKPKESSNHIPFLSRNGVVAGIVLLGVLLLLLGIELGIAFMTRTPSLRPISAAQGSESAIHEQAAASEVYGKASLSDFALTRETSEASAEKLPQEAPSSDQGDISPDSSTRELTAEDVAQAVAKHSASIPAGSNVPQMMINEILARHGYRFKTEAIQRYFESKDWYRAIGTYDTDMDAVSAQLNQIEKTNVNFLAENYR
ncbi:MAG: YARHG domain-containing protein [Peptoniphilaceae bacterium]|nr:YARHG domain-containing protein [Peptoniphilaceae bacterium]